MPVGQKTVRLRIAGHVQGVSFRVWTQREARRLGLRGWVRNERDGSVTALISGPDEVVASMLEAFWQGPPGADVRSVVPEPADAAGVPAGFDITG
ncbi:acylphosphatase [Aminobacter carboxidus]|uniref:Acylphosphatase n=1 Tax=Aminobacter carboxidus TaxID=376165 RepID=A0A8E1WHR2_9HYPH|nr:MULTISPECIES: acylphosphatase [Aminobacter carboxidus group]MBB6467681.1 acylphosphatase [Aminobacter lissarensis]MBE1205826.1 acylphosphatase [Aminobacter carboxidus]